MFFKILKVLLGDYIFGIICVKWVWKIFKFRYYMGFKGVIKLKIVRIF